MKPATRADRLTVQRILAGDATAWSDLIARFEGRLLAFAENRLRDRASSEDIVQETFVGFLNSLPNYDARRAIENYLFTICSYKLTDFLRREGRRPMIPFSVHSDSTLDWLHRVPAGRGPSSVVRSGERRDLEETALVSAMQKLLEHWQQRGDWFKVKCAELMFVRGLANKDIAGQLEVAERQVAAVKFEFITRLQQQLREQGLNVDVFPELQSPEAS
ncbi:MAG: RNA polymerase sigma factor [Planctomycetota bacterium]